MERIEHQHGRHRHMKKMLQDIEDEVRRLLLLLIKGKWHVLDYPLPYQRDSLKEHTGKDNLEDLDLEEAFKYYLHLRDNALAEKG